jgi:hypothetical protein
MILTWEIAREDLSELAQKAGMARQISTYPDFVMRPCCTQANPGPEYFSGLPPVAGDIRL